jgi:hypothetical protein
VGIGTLPRGSCNPAGVAMLAAGFGGGLAAGGVGLGAVEAAGVGLGVVAAGVAPIFGLTGTTGAAEPMGLSVLMCTTGETAALVGPGGTGGFPAGTLGTPGGGLAAGGVGFIAEAAVLTVTSLGETELASAATSSAV